MNIRIRVKEKRILFIDYEKIPHNEKMFSIFEDYTEWITKGKMRSNVELGKKTAITTDQFYLIIDYRVMDHQSDYEIVKYIGNDLMKMYLIYSWSFDKGFWHKNNKAFLQSKVENVIMPKKGKRNKIEEFEETQPVFKKLKNKHSAIESNIKELECRGLDRCPDKGYDHFKRYIGLAVSAYNLRKIGAEINALRRVQEINQDQKLAA